MEAGCCQQKGWLMMGNLNDGSSLQPEKENRRFYFRKISVCGMRISRSSNECQTEIIFNINHSIKYELGS